MSKDIEGVCQRSSFVQDPLVLDRLHHEELAKPGFRSVQLNRAKASKCQGIQEERRFEEDGQLAIVIRYVLERRIPRLP